MEVSPLRLWALDATMKKIKDAAKPECDQIQQSYQCHGHPSHILKSTGDIITPMLQQPQLQSQCLSSAKLSTSSLTCSPDLLAGEEAASANLNFFDEQTKRWKVSVEDGVYNLKEYYCCAFYSCHSTILSSNMTVPSSMCRGIFLSDSKQRWLYSLDCLHQGSTQMMQGRSCAKVWQCHSLFLGW